jgi:hypothetical protein
MAGTMPRLAGPKPASPLFHPPSVRSIFLDRLLTAALVASLATVAGCVNPPQPPKMPDELREAGTKYGKADFRESVFGAYPGLAPFPGLGPITDLRYGRFANGGGAELAVVGRSAAVFVEANGRVSSTTRFAQRLYSRAALVQREGGGAPLFLSRGSYIEKVRVLDNTGALRWDYGRLLGIDDAAAGDLNGNGKLEFVVGLNGPGGLRLFDERGRQLWSRSGANIWHVEIASSENGLPGEVIHSDARGELTFRNPAGDVLRTCRPARYVANFALTRWANEPKPRHLIVPGPGVVAVLDLNCQPTAQLDAPGLGHLAAASLVGTPVSFSPGVRYYASLINYRVWGRSLLYLNDEAGKIAYQEIIDRSCAALCTMPDPATASEFLLVGCGDEVRKYASLH